MTTNKAQVKADPAGQNIIVERVFNAPRDKVFAAMTQKDKLERWWTGPGYTNRVEHLDARDGGSWKFVQSGPNGEQFSFHGSFHLVTPEMTIQTFEFDGLGEPGHVSLQKSELFDLGDGRTRLVATSTFMSAADRDGMLHSNMEEGMQMTYEALDQVLASM
ncbi:SRPBCC family protein [Paenibacillus athensensis]|uniref:ATPase n=1 Tax=Paenibacillus athensensis TaxID=1967502 RepID=A0A4Y8PSX9_9BACL|nr:SRPBCC family protein [Paenibacillus athensensis]MCD1259268.1 SRPBCC family protein [Paenibacillus athensensis]